MSLNDDLNCRRRVRFDTAAEFLAACASGDTDEAQEMLKDAKETEGKNGDYRGEVVNCANADGITALHQVRTCGKLVECSVCVLTLQPIVILEL